MEKLSNSKITQQEIKDKFDEFVLLFKKSDSDINELRWFFDTLPIKGQAQLLLVAMNIIVGIARKECLVRDGRLSLPCSIAHDLMTIMNNAVKRTYEFNSDTPLSDLMTVMLDNPSEELSSEELDSYYSDSLRAC